MAQAEVRYRGISDERTLTQDQLKEHGIEVDHDLIWDRSNKWTLQLDLDSNFESLLRNQGHFQISEVKDSGQAGAEVAAAEDASNVGDEVVVKETNQRSKRNR